MLTDLENWGLQGNEYIVSLFYAFLFSIFYAFLLFMNEVLYEIWLLYHDIINSYWNGKGYKILLFIWATSWENLFMPYANILIRAIWSAPLLFYA